MTKGQIEAQISEAIIKFEKEYMGRGPVETRTFIIEDLIIVRLKGVLTLAEEQLTKTKDGAELIKRTRALLIEEGKTLLSDMINKITGIKVVSLHTDVSTKTGERIIVFTLEKKYEVL
ncbi:MAG: hypothetical protein A2497_02330 [Candidatus Firestonebacteria bacterium RifOxyC12_full_39_7]|nr:MAG: hypothetical protein A2536_06915 [Candidatus Firestonebacteria bacterium RIFOXYD2_FULL_39_29]OGF57165.1 MAG: hypothetical protein A2497_02330 [Candidatus Firestonebacteria bacterium RifOxyC12_full_39_7]